MNPKSALHLTVLLGVLCPFSGAIRAADPAPTVVTTTIPQLTRPQLDELLGPIALYPDALVALILPAATNPTEIVMAARFIEAKGDPGQIDNQPWSESVRALARYPEIIVWMDTNLEWTRQIGEAFLDQSDEMLLAVQRLRTAAKANGALVDTPQQQVIVDGGDIEIIPAQPDVIYVPRYDPEIVYVTRAPGYYSPDPFITFGVGFPAGIWLTNDFDWRRRTIWVGDRHHDWRYHRDWRRSNPPGPNNPNWNQWRPAPNRPRPPRDYQRPPGNVIRPRPFPGPGNSDGPRPPRPGWNNRPPRVDGAPAAPRVDATPRPPRVDGTPRPPRVDGAPRPPRVDGAPRPPRPTQDVGQPPSAGRNWGSNGSRPNPSAGNPGTPQVNRTPPPQQRAMPANPPPRPAPAPAPPQAAPPPTKQREQPVNEKQN